MAFVAASPYKAVGRYSACGEYTAMGAFTRNGYTVDYYADAGTLSFDDKNLRKFYEAVRNADIDFQKTLADLKKTIRPIMGLIEGLSGGNLRAADVEKALNIRLPSWGVALVLEVAAGKRPLDDTFKTVMRECAKDMQTLRAAFAVITGLNVIAIGSAAAPPPVGPVCITMLPITGPLAGLGVTATTATFVLEPLFNLLGSGKSPSRQQTKDMLKGAAALSGQKEPSDAQVNLVYNALEKGTKKGAGWRGGDGSGGRAAAERLKKAKAIAIAKEKAKAEAERKAREAKAAAAAAQTSSATAAAAQAQAAAVQAGAEAAAAQAEADAAARDAGEDTGTGTDTGTGSNLLPIAAGVGVLALVGALALRRK